MDRHNKRVRVLIGILLITVVIFAGCSTLTPRQIENRYDRNLTTRVLWEQCRDLRKHSRELVWYTVSSRSELLPSQMRTELALNHCPRRVL